MPGCCLVFCHSLLPCLHSLLLGSFGPGCRFSELLETLLHSPVSLLDLRMPLLQLLMCGCEMTRQAARNRT